VLCDSWNLEDTMKCFELASLSLTRSNLTASYAPSWPKVRRRRGPHVHLLPQPLIHHF
jgi:hypothetical protein